MIDRVEKQQASAMILTATEQALGVGVGCSAYVTSGMAGDIFRVWLRDGRTAIVKTARPERPTDFSSEAHALGMLAATNTVPVPEVLGVGADCLVMADLGSIEQTPTDAQWAILGAQLGQLHWEEGPHLGYVGSDTPVDPDETWADFWACRIRELTRLWRNPEVLTDDDLAGIERIIKVYGPQVPPSKPILCHGDLWRNNVHLGDDGRLYVIDPSLDYSHPEADLATTRINGPFPEVFYAGYRNTHPLADDWETRLPLYLLKELLGMTAQIAHEPSLRLLREFAAKA